MFFEEELLPISGLQHLAFCERQCALIHLERVWEENIFTSEGRILHEKAHTEEVEIRDGIRIARSLPLKSISYGLVGIADVVEFHPTSSREGVVLSGLAGSWLPYPVEYKRGRRKKDSCDKIQLCSQALCLEEMLNVDIPEGALFYGKSRRRLIVSIDKKLRNLTLDFIKKFRNLLAEGVTPKGDYGPKCDSCSLKEICLPQIKKSSSSLSRYLNSFFEEEDC